MKKMAIFLVIIVAIFVLLGVFTNMKKEEKSKGNPYGKDKLHPATVDQLDDPNYQNLILPEELEQDLQDNKDMTVYFYSPTCTHCQKTTPIVAPLAEKLGIDLVQYNLKEFEQGWSDYGIKKTPTIVHYKNGQEQERIVGFNEEVTFEKWFKDHDIN
ncbi:thioredoxin family protein [Peribacillus sp. ACCC06369]|uniref:thioredoxin family protein n=1 Tax=Peribacillus sp. ACCC06369 TaxID=3055860 RepID=UPI0025A04C4F|nr:thioredoxin family protein [Peribacillus sp. ACCC06369]MDM5357368.1 thioredoxin family protein [Peribacillus sp. ACCC06369]